MWDWISALHQLSQERRPFALVVVTKVAGSVPREPGAKMVVFEDGSFLGTVGGGHFEKLSIADAQACLRDGVARSFRYPLGPSAGQCCGGVVETFIEPHHRNPDIYVFGAGHVAQALARTLEGTPFRVTVIDERSEWVHAKGLGPAVQRCEGEWFDIAPQLTWDAANTYVAIMTHRHDLDQDIVEWVCSRPARYLGLIGSKTKWAKFQARLLEKGISQANLDRIKCPIGLDTGGKAPQEVAISVAGELLKIHYGR